MTAAISLLVILVLSVLITRIAAVALTLTGLSKELARFQARSAFTGCGFTTKETEYVMNHPVRRRIILTLMLLGNAGIITSVASLMLTFVEREAGTALWVRVVLLACGITAIWLLTSSQWITRLMERAIHRALAKWTSITVHDYASLLRLSDGFTVSEVRVTDEDWVVDRSLADLMLPAEGITVLGIHREDGRYVGVPTGSTKIRPGDVLILYGRAEAIEKLDGRRKGAAGNQEHEQAIQEEKGRLKAQQEADQNREARQAP